MQGSGLARPTVPEGAAGSNAPAVKAKAGKSKPDASKVPNAGTNVKTAKGNPAKAASESGITSGMC